MTCSDNAKRIESIWNIQEDFVEDFKIALKFLFRAQVHVQWYTVTVSKKATANGTLLQLNETSRVYNLIKLMACLHKKASHGICI